jgi:hypothetical protein
VPSEVELHQPDGGLLDGGLIKENKKKSNKITIIAIIAIK